MKTVKIFIEHDPRIMTSYQYIEWISKTFGDREVEDNFEEIRDRLGYLKGYNVEIRIDE